MIKRTIMSIAAISAASMMTFSVSAAEVDGPEVNWNLSVWGKERAFTSGIEAIRDYVAEKTDGKFNIKIHYGEALSKSRENLDGIKLGAFQMAALCTAYHPAKNPTLSGLDLPFLPFPNLRVQTAVHEAYYQNPAVAEDMARWDAMLLMSSLLPQYEFTGVGDPPLTLEDWDGMRVRALGGIGEAMKKIGAVPTTVPAPEVYTSLERGTIEAASFPFTYAHVAYRLTDIGKWHTANMSPGANHCPIVVNIPAYEQLTPEYQQLLNDAKGPAYEALYAAYEAADKKNFPLMKEKGIQAITYSDEELDKFRAVGAKPVWDEWIAKMESEGHPGTELFELIMTTSKQATN
ncbi:TRAP transporter substrate-binding protein DctP [uncultured Sneathiella sp.]|jgi:TRAP-type mannitol/chloroaromatic compound transport system substrate-binding protein|uniref:TRAP transporter substrate-binding protein DctP n=1 Tax=uncultured Sneathiella sp. TaxID=879315 RepID=UPI0030D7F961|tara:strand:- start:1426 stop:2466 length:1041 start_codon:yes stop_codon:yes gene_type:complete